MRSRTHSQERCADRAASIPPTLLHFADHPETTGENGISGFVLTNNPESYICPLIDFHFLPLAEGIESEILVVQILLVPNPLAERATYLESSSSKTRPAVSAETKPETGGVYMPFPPIGEYQSTIEDRPDLSGVLTVNDDQGSLSYQRTAGKKHHTGNKNRSGEFDFTVTFDFEPSTPYRFVSSKHSNNVYCGDVIYDQPEQQQTGWTATQN